MKKLSVILIMGIGASVAHAQSVDSISTQQADHRVGFESTSFGVPKSIVPRITNQSTENTKIGSDNTELKQTGLSTQIFAQKLDKNDFQTFVKYATGKDLPLFGTDFFQNPNQFGPQNNVPVPVDYIVGPGDEFILKANGSVDIDYRAVVDRNGVISIPTIGSVNIAGKRIQDAEASVKAAVGKMYRDVSMNVSLGKLRSITVYVVGQAKKPGAYTVPGYSTLVSALISSGGPSARGSMRQVQVKRNGKVVTTMDLYNFLAKGDKSQDVRLVDGDTIYIPIAFGHLAINGEIGQAAIYEIKAEQESVGALLNLVGGLPVIADPRKIILERINPGQNSPRSVEEFSLNKEGLNKALKNGDLLTVLAMTPDFSNAVTLRGNVNQALRVPFKNGMRIRDVIPSKEVLLTKAAVRQRNEGVDESGQDIANRIGNFVDEINWEYAVVERTNKATLEVSLLPFNLGNAMNDASSSDNLNLQAGDAINVFSNSDIRVPIAKRKVFVRVEGEVSVPGVYEMRSGDDLQSLISKAGGLTNNAYVFGSEFYREQVRMDQQANLEKTIKKLEDKVIADKRNAQASTNISLSDSAAKEKYLLDEKNSQEAAARLRNLRATGRVALMVETQSADQAQFPKLKLENGDRLIVPSKPDFVHLFGSVNQEASVIWRQGMTVEKYLAQAGTSIDADLDNVFVMRANGSIVSASGRGWFSNVGGVEVLPGDTIVVPEKTSRETPYKTFMNGLKDWAQVLSGFGLGAAAIKSLK